MRQVWIAAPGPPARVARVPKALRSQQLSRLQYLARQPSRRTYQSAEAQALLRLEAIAANPREDSPVSRFDISFHEYNAKKSPHDGGQKKPGRYE